MIDNCQPVLHFFTTYSKAVLLILQQMELLGFSYHLMPQCDSSPNQSSCTRLGPLEDALPTELQHCGYNPCKVNSTSVHLKSFNLVLVREYLFTLVIFESCLQSNLHLNSSCPSTLCFIISASVESQETEHELKLV